MAKTYNAGQMGVGWSQVFARDINPFEAWKTAQGRKAEEEKAKQQLTKDNMKELQVKFEGEFWREDLNRIQEETSKLFEYGVNLSKKGENLSTSVEFQKERARVYNIMEASNSLKKEYDAEMKYDGGPYFNKDKYMTAWRESVASKTLEERSTTDIPDKSSKEFFLSDKYLQDFASKYKESAELTDYAKGNLGGAELGYTETKFKFGTWENGRYVAKANDRAIDGVLQNETYKASITADIERYYDKRAEEEIRSGKSTMDQESLKWDLISREGGLDSLIRNKAGQDLMAHESKSQDRKTKQVGLPSSYGAGAGKDAELKSKVEGRLPEIQKVMSGDFSSINSAAAQAAAKQGYKISAEYKGSGGVTIGSVLDFFSGDANAFNGDPNIDKIVFTIQKPISEKVTEDRGNEKSSREDIRYGEPETIEIDLSDIESAIPEVNRMLSLIGENISMEDLNKYIKKYKSEAYDSKEEKITYGKVIQSDFQENRERREAEKALKGLNP